MDGVDEQNPLSSIHAPPTLPHLCHPWRPIPHRAYFHLSLYSCSFTPNNLAPDVLFWPTLRNLYIVVPSIRPPAPTPRPRGLRASGLSRPSSQMGERPGKPLLGHGQHRGQRRHRHAPTSWRRGRRRLVRPPARQAWARQRPWLAPGPARVGPPPEPGPLHGLPPWWPLPNRLLPLLHVSRLLLRLGLPRGRRVNLGQPLVHLPWRGMGCVVWLRVVVGGSVDGLGFVGKVSWAE